MGELRGKGFERAVSKEGVNGSGFDRVLHKDSFSLTCGYVGVEETISCNWTVCTYLG